MDQELAHLQRSTAEKMASAVLPAAVAEWTAAEAMHLAHVHATLPLSGTTVLLTAVAWGAAGRQDNVPDSLPWWVAITGGWLTAAADLGPLDWWPAPMLTAAFVILAFAARRAAYRRKAVTDAREWRGARADWLAKRHSWGLGGSHLLDYREDKGTEWYLVSTKGTGKRASQFERRGTAEIIAEAENLPHGRVQVKRGHIAGRLEITVIRAAHPWAEPELHPHAAGGDPSALPATWSVKDGPARVGPSLAITLWGRTGAKTVNIVSIRGWGKTVLLNNISERVTAADDAILVRINLSIKGAAEPERWGPGCHLTAFGPQQTARAVAVLTVVNKVIEWRAARYTTTFYEPKRKDPLIAVLVEESDSAMADARVRRLADDISTKGRELGVAYVRAGQRGTNDYGSGKQKSQDEVTVTGAVKSKREVRYSAGDDAWSIPDMAALAEGNPGVWAVDELGGVRQRDRAWLLERADSARLAAERAFGQPELHPDCVAYLGEPYQQLLATEVFTRWAHAHQDDDTPDEPGFVPVDVEAVRGRQMEAGSGTETQAAAQGTAVAEDDLEQMWDANVTDKERVHLRALTEKLTGVRQVIEETAAMPARGNVTPKDLETAADEAWQKAGEQAEIPEEARPRLLEMLRGGTTIRKVAGEFGVTQWTARTWLEKLRGQNLAYVDGEKKAARWRLAPPPAEGDAP